MTLQEILKAKGLSDEDIESTIGEMKQNKIFTASEENLDIRFKDLQGKFGAKDKEHKEALERIKQFEEANAGTANLQGELDKANQTIADLTKQINDQKADAAMDRALTEAGANAGDLDYLKFQWRKKGEICLNDNGEIDGKDDAIAAMKTQCPNQFVSAAAQRQVEPQPLPQGDGNRTIEPANLAEAIEQKFTKN